MRGLVALWLVAAMGFALWRIPFDDEWFSITLARDTSWEQFLWSLRHDVHPPWLALFDRVLVQFTGTAAAIGLSRLTAVALALVLLSSVLSRQTTLAPSAVAFAAFHPIVFMYAGSARWYPMLLVAQALRAWALWGPRPGSWSARGAFGLGALLGPACGYVDLLFVAVDAGWLVLNGKRAGRLGSSLAVSLSALALAGAQWIGALVILQHLPLFGARANPAQLDLSAGLTWLALGPLGEAHLPFPWLALAVLALPGLVWSLVLLLRKAPSPFRGWLVTVALSWFVATPFGIWHPRYSLMLWLVSTAALGFLWKARRSARVAVLGTCGYLALGLALTVDQRSFFKGDLNRLTVDDCGALLRAPEVDLIVAPYPRTAAELTRVCHPVAPVVTAGLVRHFHWSSRGDVEPIAQALEGRHQVELVYLITDSSLGITNSHSRALLETRCVLADAVPAVHGPHLALKRLQFPRATSERFMSERWRCEH